MSVTFYNRKNNYKESEHPRGPDGKWIKKGETPSNANSNDGSKNIIGYSKTGSNSEFKNIPLSKMMRNSKIQV